MTSLPPSPWISSPPRRPAITSSPDVPRRLSCPVVPTIVAWRPSQIGGVIPELKAGTEIVDPASPTNTAEKARPLHLQWPTAASLAQVRGAGPPHAHL